MRRLRHRVGSVLAWTALLLLGAFGMYFSLANYPVYGIALLLLALVLVVYSEWSRRQRRRTLERARRRAHT